MKRLTPATKFWIGVGVYALAADTILWRSKNHTMSQQWGAWIQTRKGRTACAAAWGLLTAHLFWSVPLPLQGTAKKVATYKMKKEEN